MSLVSILQHDIGLLWREHSGKGLLEEYNRVENTKVLGTSPYGQYRIQRSWDRNNLIMPRYRTDSKMRKKTALRWISVNLKDLSDPRRPQYTTLPSSGEGRGEGDELEEDT